MNGRALAPIVLLLASATASTARAQQPMVGGFFEGGTGLEMGGRAGGVVAHRARTILSAGASLGNREWPNEALFVAASVEIEPTPSFGGWVAWSHRFGRFIGLHAGIASVLAPQTMLGPLAGARLRVSIAKNLSVLAGADLKVFPIGSDVPDGSVVFVTTVSGGVHADF
jgi:hypothetical protein